MARNGSGTYSKVNTFVAAQTITAAGHNQNWDDLVSEMTNSVAVDGQSTMTGPLKASNGSAAAPSWTFGSDLDSGFYRITANSIGLSLDGVLRVEFTTASISVALPINFAAAINIAGGAQNGLVGTPTYSFASDLDTGIYRIGANNLGIAAGGGKIIDISTATVAITGVFTASSTVNSSGLLTASAGLTVVGAVTLPAASVALAALATKPAVVLIQTQAASNSATIDFTTGLDDTLYDAFEIRLSSIKPQTDDTGLWIQVGTGVGPTYQTSGYHQQGYIGLGSLVADSNTSATEFRLTGQGSTNGVGNATGENASGVITFNNPEASDFMLMSFKGSYVAAAGNLADRGMSGMLNTAGAVTGIRFKFSSGNIASGRLSLYGYVKA